MKKNWTNITFDEFIHTYNTYPPNWWIRFIFKYFSKNSERKNLKVKKSITGILLGLFGFGLLGTILNWSDKLIGIFVIIYAILLVSIIISIFIAVYMNNRRIKKIINKLDITIEEYNLLVDKYL